MDRRQFVEGILALPLGGLITLPRMSPPVQPLRCKRYLSRVPVSREQLQDSDAAYDLRRIFADHIRKTVPVLGEQD